MVYFREVQRFRQPWLVAMMFIPAVALAVSKKPAVAGATLLFPAWLLSARLITEVRDDELEIRFLGLWPRKIVPFSEVRNAKAVTYNPLVRGWGVHWMPGLGWTYNVSGNRGVELELTNGARLVVGSQRPDDLAEALVARLAVHQR